MGYISTNGIEGFDASAKEAVAPISADSVTNYRKYSTDYDDAGRYVSEVLPVSADYSPNFYSRNTGQTWDVSNGTIYSVISWKGNTLANRSVHEIIINNNGNTTTSITFSDNYLLVDEEEGISTGKQLTTIAANTTAHYYCTAVYEQGSLFLHLRKGSQDTRPIRSMEILTEGDQQ